MEASNGAGKRIFEPVELGPIALRNRTIRAAAFEGMSDGHRPTPALVDYHRAVAAGGVGMTTVAYAAVERSGLTFSHQLWLRDEIVPDLRTLTDAVHARGARVSIQIGHAGNMAKRAVTGERAMAPSSLPNLYGPSWPRSMNERDIARVVESFGRATEIAAGAGFDAVEVHAGHGYLISQFLSPATNHRRDAHGGALEQRMRLMRQVIERVLRASGGRIAVLVKMNLSDGFSGGQTLEEAIEIARTLERDGAHALVLSGGFVSRSPMYILRGAMPMAVMAEQAGWLGPMIRAIGTRLVREVRYQELYFLTQASMVRDAVRMPLVYVGGVTSAAGIAKVLDAGFDAVAMARALIQDPNFVNRLKTDETADSACNHCNYCAARIYGTHMACYLVTPPPEHLARFIRPARTA
jgi:2,4-dienoyl-CoA reductase-like NADH-dependent reductase (Old Yellow Enzyme family)